MLRPSNICLDPDALAERLHDAPAATAALLHDVIDLACRRFPSPGQRIASERIDRLIQAEAWADAALALTDQELPNWRVRRIAYDGGDWHCALSRERELPDWLDQAVEAWHPDLALAILGAFIEAQSLGKRSTRSSVPSVPREAGPRPIAICCDNYA